MPTKTMQEKLEPENISLSDIAEEVSKIYTDSAPNELTRVEIEFSAEPASIEWILATQEQQQQVKLKYRKDPKFVALCTVTSTKINQDKLIVKMEGYRLKQ